MVTKRDRPRVLKSLTVKQPTGHGTMYITVTLDEAGVPFEVFIALGKAGSCEHAWIEALSRAISTGLRCGIPVSEYVDQLTHIQCGHSVSDKGRARMVTSCADALALVLSDLQVAFQGGPSQGQGGPSAGT